MRKFIYLILILLLSALFVYAIGEGDKLTQSQVDSINFDTVDLRCSRMERRGEKVWFVEKLSAENDWRVSRAFNCLSLNQTMNEQNQTIYIIRNQTFYPSFLWFSEYQEKIQERGNETIIAEIRKKLNNQRDSDILTLREKLKRFQTTQDPDEDWNNFG